jgi:hypothetical protein
MVADWRTCSYRVTYLADVLAVVIPSRHDPYGQVSEGHIRLLAHIRAGCDRHAVENLYAPHFRYEQFDDGYELGGERAPGRSLYCALVYREPTQHWNDSEPGVMIWDRGFIMGFILETVKDTSQTYRRVGMFVHPWRKGKDEDIAKEYPEFLDVERPKELERQEIIII